MATSTIDNASATLAIALQLRDLDELEASGVIVDDVVIRLQRQQLEIDSAFDGVTFEASRRLAVSMARAVEDDGALLAQSRLLAPIDDVTFERLARLNRLPSRASDRIEAAPQSHKRARSLTPEPESSSSSANPKVTELPRCSHATLDHARHPQKKPKIRGEQVSSTQKLRNGVDNSEITSVQASEASAADVISVQVMKETAASVTAVETSPTTAECAGCSDSLTIDELVKASCEHYYCKDCFGHFIEASLQTHDGFPPKCCKIPIAFGTVADNVSAAVFSRYSARQAEIKNATALYCGLQGCGVRIEVDRIDGVRATCMACWRDTCIQCRGEFPRKVNGKNVGHVCKKDKAREEVLALAREEGWQTCFQCGNMIALNFGCHHMRCRCKAEFCYRCGTEWKKCNCGDYDEGRLGLRAARGINIRAAHRIRRNLPHDVRPREQQLAELQQRLQTDCDHNDFFYEDHSKSDPGHCRVCEYPGWKYILRCVNCRFTACRDCHNFFGWNGGEDPWEEFMFGGRNHDENTDDELFTEDGSNGGQDASRE